MVRLMRAWSLTFGLVWVAGTAAAMACSCAPPPAPKVALEAAAAVFVGKVTKRGNLPNSFLREVTFEVERQWKGVATPAVTVTTAQDGAACGVHFEVGQRYLVYCYRANANAPLATNLCTRTCLLKEAQGDLMELGPGTPPQP